MKLLVVFQVALSLVDLVHPQEESCSKEDLLEVRLQESNFPESNYAGRVEVRWREKNHSANQWQAACGDSWTSTDAGVVCRQLHFTNAQNQGKRYCACTSLILPQLPSK